MVVWGSIGIHDPDSPEPANEFRPVVPAGIRDVILRALNRPVAARLRSALLPTPPRLADAGADLLQRLEEEIPAKWLREVQRLYAESEAQQTA